MFENPLEGPQIAAAPLEGFGHAWNLWRASYGMFRRLCNFSPSLWRELVRSLWAEPIGHVCFLVFTLHGNTMYVVERTFTAQ